MSKHSPQFISHRTEQAHERAETRKPTQKQDPGIYPKGYESLYAKWVTQVNGGAAKKKAVAPCSFKAAILATMANGKEQTLHDVARKLGYPEKLTDKLSREGEEMFNDALTDLVRSGAVACEYISWPLLRVYRLASVPAIPRPKPQSIGQVLPVLTEQMGIMGVAKLINASRSTTRTLLLKLEAQGLVERVKVGGIHEWRRAHVGITDRIAMAMQEAAE